MNAAGFRAAQVAAGAEIEEALQPFAAAHWKEALGAAGTVGAVSQILRAAGVSDGRITPAGSAGAFSVASTRAASTRWTCPG